MEITKQEAEEIIKTLLSIEARVSEATKLIGIVEFLGRRLADGNMDKESK